MTHSFNPDPAPYSRMLTITGVCLLLLVAAMLFSGCSPRVIETIHVEYRDTTIIRDFVRDSVIMVPIPLEKNQAIVSIDDTSHLETSLAVSDAYVTADGRLHHELANRHGESLPAIVPIHYHITSTVKASETAQVITKTVEVEKHLTWMQSLKIKAFPWLLGLAVALGLWTLSKPLLKFLSKF